MDKYKATKEEVDKLVEDMNWCKSTDELCIDERRIWAAGRFCDILRELGYGEAIDIYNTLPYPEDYD